MISDPPFTILDQPEEVDEYLRTTGNFVRMAELRQHMKTSSGICSLADAENHAFLTIGMTTHPMSVILIDKKEMDFRSALLMIQQSSGCNFQIAIRPPKSVN